MNKYPTHTNRQPVAGGAASFAVLALLTLAVILVSPYVLTVSRAVVNLPISAVAVAWGRMHGADCDLHADLMVTCQSMTSGFSRGGTTLGNVWMYDDLDGPGRHRHEARHADQWAMFRAVFPVLYGIDCLLAEGDPHRVLFERSAGLGDGGYLR